MRDTLKSNYHCTISDFKINDPVLTKEVMILDWWDPFDVIEIVN